MSPINENSKPWTGAVVPSSGSSRSSQLVARQFETNIDVGHPFVLQLACFSNRMGEIFNLQKNL